MPARAAFRATSNDARNVSPKHEAIQQRVRSEHARTEAPARALSQELASHTSSSACVTVSTASARPRLDLSLCVDLCVNRSRAVREPPQPHHFSPAQHSTHTTYTARITLCVYDLHDRTDGERSAPCSSSLTDKVSVRPHTRGLPLSLRTCCLSFPLLFLSRSFAATGGSSPSPQRVLSLHCCVAPAVLLRLSFVARSATALP